MLCVPISRKSIIFPHGRPAPRRAFFVGGRLRPNGERHLLATVRDSRRPQPRHGGESGGRGVRLDGGQPTP